MSAKLRSLFGTCLLTLALALPGRADTTYTYQGQGTFYGKGTIEVVGGVGNAKVTGRCEIRTRGLGTVTAPAGILFRTSVDPSWHETDGNPLHGFGWIILRPNGDDSVVELGGIASLHVNTRLGGIARVELSGSSGTVTASARFLPIAGNLKPVTP